MASINKINAIDQYIILERKIQSNLILVEED